MTFITNLINGVSLGSIYAVIALGYTMVYGIAKMLNFAHGDVIMVGAYIVFALTSYAGVNPYLALVISMAACTLLGMAIERFAYKPLRGASPLAVLITAIGVSYFLQNMALLIFGSQAKSFTSIVNLPALTLAGGKITISAETIVTIIVSLIIMVSLTLFVNKTKPGRAMLAVSEDKGAAQLMGVNVNATISLTFAIGSGLSGLSRDGLDGLLNIENFDKSLAENVMLLTPFAANATDETTKKFVAAYNAKYDPSTLNQFAADAYDAVYIVKAAAEKAGVTGDMSVSDICNALKGAMTEITVDGVTGSGMTWKATGEVNKEPKAVKIENGEYQPMD